MKKQASIGIIFLTVLIDLIGFGLILPLIPVFSNNFGASGFVVGGIMASYSLMQFVFAPLWGRLSDRIGRRPVLLGSTACATASYLILGFALGRESHVLALWLVLLSRVIAGVCGANITVAQAYIADITPPEQRSAKMGLVGMAFGLGFILGPAIGGFASKYWGITAPGWVAASLCALNFFSALVRLPESWKPSEHSVIQRPHLAQWMHTLSTPNLNLLIGVFFLATFCFTCFESTIGLLIMKNFMVDTTKGDGLAKVSWLIVFCGVIAAIVNQRKFIGRLVKGLGEPKLIGASLVIAAIGIIILPFAKTWGMLYLGLGIFSIGSSLTRPPVFGMISMLTAAHEQGTNLGVAQGVGSLARVIGPLFAVPLFFSNTPLPYEICGCLSFITGLIAWFCLLHVKVQTTATPSAPAVH